MWASLAKEYVKKGLCRERIEGVSRVHEMHREGGLPVV